MENNNNENKFDTKRITNKEDFPGDINPGQAFNTKSYSRRSFSEVIEASQESSSDYQEYSEEDFFSSEEDFKAQKAKLNEDFSVFFNKLLNDPSLDENSPKALYKILQGENTILPFIVKYLNFIGIFLIIILIISFFLDKNIFLIGDILIGLSFFALIYNKSKSGLLLTIPSLLVNLYGLLKPGYVPFFNRFMNFLGLIGSLLLILAFISLIKYSQAKLNDQGRRIIY